MSEREFSGRVVLVTGGAKGVGRGITECFLRAGATVVICGRNAPEQPVTVDGRAAEFIAADVVDEASVEALFKALAERHGRLDVAINNAGGTPFRMAAQALPRYHEKIFRLNALAPLMIAQRANALMQAQAEGGVIEFIGSISAQRGQPGTAAYGAAKAAIASLVKSLALEWAPKVRVVSVSPGPVETELSEMHYGDAAGVAAVAKTIALQRLAVPVDIGEACRFLASSAARYISGADLLVHGGGERPPFLDAASVNKP